MTVLDVNNPTSEIAMTRTLAAKTAAEKTPFYRKLYVQVLIAVALGAILGHLYPDLSVYLKPYGDAFIKAIKIVVAPIIFTTIVVGIAKMGDIRRVANVGVKALIYFEIASTLALIIGMIVGNFWKVGIGLNADPAAFDTKAVEAYAKVAKNVNLTDFFLSMIPTSFVEPFVKGDIMPVLFIAVLLGAALSLAQARGKPIVSFLDSVSVALFGMVRIIMYFAPLAALSSMAFTVGKYGLRTLLDLGQLDDDAAFNAEAREGRRFQRGRRLGDAGGIFLQHGRHRDLHDHGRVVPRACLQRRADNLASAIGPVRDAVHVEGRGGCYGRRVHRACSDAAGDGRRAGRGTWAAARRRSLHGGNPRRDQSDVQHHRDACGGSLGGSGRHERGSRRVACRFRRNRRNARVGRRPRH